MNRDSNLSECKRPPADWKWRLSDRDFHIDSSISGSLFLGSIKMPQLGRAAHQRCCTFSFSAGGGAPHLRSAIGCDGRRLFGSVRTGRRGGAVWRRSHEDSGGVGVARAPGVADRCRFVAGGAGADELGRGTVPGALGAQGGSAAGVGNDGPTASRRAANAGPCCCCYTELGCAPALCCCIALHLTGWHAALASCARSC